MRTKGFYFIRVDTYFHTIGFYDPRQGEYPWDIVGSDSSLSDSEIMEVVGGPIPCPVCKEHTDVNPA